MEGVTLCYFVPVSQKMAWGEHQGVQSRRLGLREGPAQAVGQDTGFPTTSPSTHRKASQTGNSLLQRYKSSHSDMYSNKLGSGHEAGHRQGVNSL